MSSTKRIKQIRKRNNLNSFDGIPLGTDGLLVDMISGLDLEEELRLGNNHRVSIEEISDTVTQITELYYNSNSFNTLEYSVVIRIEEIPAQDSTQITMTLYKGAAQAVNKLHEKVTVIDESSSIIQISEEVDGE